MRKIIRRHQTQSKALLHDLHPILQKIYAHRGVTTSHELEYTLAHLASYESLSGIATAVDLLMSALQQQQCIVIVADFDADGATSCAVCLLALRAMGAKQVNYVVPNRFKYGYGLTPEIVILANQYKPQLIITVDNGISSHAGVDTAHSLGIKVLITDHHMPPPDLPAADAIVNPNLVDDRFPSKSLAGVGVIFYVMMALRARLRASGWFSAHYLSEPNLAELLDLVALGTVADVVPLDYNNRILISQGLARIRAGRCRSGIQALARVAGRQLQRMSASDLSFAIAPRLNAAGRITDMSLGIECLVEPDFKTAYSKAIQLDHLNKERKEIEGRMQEQALSLVEDIQSDNSSNLAALAIYDPDWHPGVVGILAARVKDRMNCPVIAFADGTEPNQIRGSGRSVHGFHIRDAIEAVAMRFPGLITHFGGHAMAAGLTLDRSQFATFRQAFAEEAEQRLKNLNRDNVIWSDGQLAPEDFSIETAQLIEDAGPWGQGFSEPLFDGKFVVKQYDVVGERHGKFILNPPNTQQLISAFAFNHVETTANYREMPVEAAFKLGVNHFNGCTHAQLLLECLYPINDSE